MEDIVVVVAMEIFIKESPEEAAAYFEKQLADYIIESELELI